MPRLEQADSIFVERIYLLETVRIPATEFAELFRDARIMLTIVELSKSDPDWFFGSTLQRKSSLSLFLPLGKF